MFYGSSFIFNGIPSEFYNLQIGDIGGSGEYTSEGDSVSLITNKLFRRASPIFYGAEQTPVLSFPLSFYSEDEISAKDYSSISAWLFGQQNYKVLRICQPDMQEIYFNCFLNDPEVIRIGNIIKAFTVQVECDSPYGYREAKTYAYTYGAYYTSGTIEFYNESDSNFYSYPKVFTITANSYGGTVTITNTTDGNRALVISLSPDEVVTLDCDLQIMSSSSETYPLSNFNKNWLRFIRGLNTLTVEGNIASMSITTKPIEVKVA